MNFSLLKSHLNRFNINYEDNSHDYIWDSYLQAKTTKTYSCETQKHIDQLYQFIHPDLVGPINLIGFLGEKYFFTFTDYTTRMTEIYTREKKRFDQISKDVLQPMQNQIERDSPN